MKVLLAHLILWIISFNLTHAQITEEQILNGFPSSFRYLRTDFDMDGIKDLVVFKNNYIHVYHFENLVATEVSKRYTGLVDGYSPADINGDGFPEIVFVSQQNVGYVPNNGGQFGQVITIGTAGNNQKKFSNARAHDLDNDGDGDLVLLMEDGQFFIVENINNTFDLGGKVRIYDELGSSSRIDFCDYNQDGNMDIIFYHSYQGVYILINTGDKTFVTTRLSDQGNFKSYGIGDFNGDGYPEIVHLRYSGSANAPYGDLKVISNPYGECCIDGYSGGLWYPGEMDIIDLDQDMQPEIVVCDDQSFTVFRFENGNLIKEKIWGTIDSIPYPATTYLDIDDFDGDGKLEFIRPTWQQPIKIFQTDFLLSPVAEYSCSGKTDKGLCPASDVIINRQEDIDAFKMQFPYCSDLNGSLWVEGNIQNLSPLSAIRHVNGSVVIRNTSLHSITGLNLTYIKNDLIIEGNTLMAHLDLNKLLFVKRHFILSDNPLLKQINSFDKLQMVSHITIKDHPQLKRIAGFKEVDNPKSVTFLNNSNLDTLLGFLDTERDFTLRLINSSPSMIQGFKWPDTLLLMNSTYQDLSPFFKLVPEHLELVNVQQVTSLAGLSPSLQLSLKITDCPDFTHFGLPLTINNLELIHNEKLTDLTGLNTSQYLLKNLKIINNPLLTSLQGLNKFSIVTHEFIIEGNQLLNDISAIHLTQPESTDTLSIANNPMLGICNIPYICRYFDTGRPYHFAGNAEGCATPEQTKESCGIIPCFANAGRDTTLCISLNTGLDTFFLGADSIVTGGAPPYTYIWSGLNSVSGQNYSASYFLHDTSSTHPLLVNFAGNAELLTFRLDVIDSLGNTCADSLTIHFSQYGWTLDYKSAHIYPGDSAQLNLSIFGGIPPYTYLWTPSAGLSNPADPYTLASPDTAISYTLFLTDSAGCIGLDYFDVFVNTTLTLPLSVNTISSIVFPHPLSDRSLLTFSPPINQIAHIDFYNSIGQCIKRMSTNENEVKLDRSSFEPGIYFYTIRIQHYLPLAGRLLVE